MALEQREAVLLWAVVIWVLYTAHYAFAAVCSDADSCRTPCALQCNGHTGCSTDACGLLSCDCSGYGDVDPSTAKCLCDAGHNPTSISATDCNIQLSGTDCAQGQVVGLFQPPLPVQVCLSGATQCFNGATPYADGSFSSGVQTVSACNAPLIGPYSLVSPVSSTASYLGVVRGVQYDLALTDIGSTLGSPVGGDGPLMWWTFQRRSINQPVYSIHSAFDHNRTLEIALALGSTVVRLSAHLIHTPTLWYIPKSPALFTTFSVFSNDDRSQHLSYTASPTAYGQYTLTLSAQATSALIWIPNIAQNQLSVVTNTGAVFTGAGAVLLRPAFRIYDPLACLDHCRRDLLCVSASYEGGACFMLSTAGSLAPGGFADIGWALLPKPFLYSGQPTYCLVPTLGADCQPLTIGYVRLQSGAESVALQQDASVISVTMATKQIQWTNRGGTLAGAPRPLTGSPNWRFVNVDNGNEFIIFPQSSDQFVLGVVGGSTVGLVAYTPSSPVTWFRAGSLNYHSPTGTNATVSDAFQLALSSNPSLVLGSLSASPTVLSVQLAAGSFAVSSFRWSFNENDPFATPDRLMHGHQFESRYSPSMLHCLSGCILSDICRAVSWTGGSTNECRLFDAPIGVQIPYPSTVAVNWTSVSRSYGDTYLAGPIISIGQSVCDKTTFGSNEFVLRYPDIYSYREPNPFMFVTSLGQALVPPTSYCITPALPLVQFRLLRDTDYVIRTAHGGGVFAEVVNAAIGAFDGWMFTFKFAMDGGGVFEIYSGSHGFESLEMDRAGASISGSATELKLIIQDVRPRQPARWRCVGWPSACTILESFDEPGRFVQLCSSFTTVGAVTPMCVTYITTPLQIVSTANQWSIQTALTRGSPTATACGFRTGETVSKISRFAYDYQMCAGMASRIATYNGFVFDSATLGCDIYVVTGFTTFLTGGPPSWRCGVLNDFASISGVAGGTCGIYGFPFNANGCTGPTALPNMILVSAGGGTLGSTPGPTPFTLVATGHNANSYMICTWQQASFTQTFDASGFTGTTTGSTAVAFYPTACLTYDASTNAVTLGLISNTAPATFLLGGAQLGGEGFDTCAFGQVVITVPQAGTAQFLVYSATSNPTTVSAAVLDVSQSSGVDLNWILEFNHCSQLAAAYRENAVLGIIPDFYGPSSNYLIEQFVTNSLLDCQGRTIDNFAVGGFVWIPGARASTCSLYSNFGYITLAGFGQTSMSTAPGAIAWRRGNFGGLHPGVADVSYPLNPQIAPVSSFAPMIAPAQDPSFNLYSPWNLNTRGYGKWSTATGCTGSARRGAFAMAQPYSPDFSGAHMTNAWWPVYNYAACSAATSFEPNLPWYMPAFDDSSSTLCNALPSLWQPLFECLPGGLVGVRGDIWSSASPINFLSTPCTLDICVYEQRTVILNVIILSGGGTSGTVPPPDPSFGGPVSYSDGVWLAFTTAPNYALWMTPPAGRTPPNQFLCVQGLQTSVGAAAAYFQPIFELRTIANRVDGFGRSFATLNAPSSTGSLPSVPRDCIFQLHRTGNVF